MDVVVKGRHCSVTDRFRLYVEDKLERLERFATKIIRVEVEVSKERNPRIADRSERVELTVLSKGPAVRAEAAADDRFVALDLALDRLLTRLRKAADRRRIHHGSRTPVSVARATADLGRVEPAGRSVRGEQSRRAAAAGSNGRARSERAAVGVVAAGAPIDATADVHAEPDGSAERDGSSDVVAGLDVIGDGPLVVREKTHNGSPISLDQALYEMELVGHDFYLFVDAECRLPSVVYRRRGYDYGVIRLEAAV